MKILQLNYKMPFPLKDGGEYSIYNSALSLLMQPNTELKTISINTKKNWVEVDDIPIDFRKKTKFDYAKVDTRIKPKGVLLNLFTNKSYFSERFHSKSYRLKISETLRKDTFDIILLEHLYMCAYIPVIRKYSDAKIILRAQNIEFKIWETYLEYHKNIFSKWYLKLSLKRLKKFEFSSLLEVDGIITLTNEDKVTYHSIYPNVKIETIPIGFNFDLLYHEKHQLKSEPIIYHLGSMDWRPNIQGMTWFIKKVLPVLKQLCPTIQIRIAGKQMPKSFYQFEDNNFHVDGEVDNAIEYQRNKSILFVPLLSGSGIRVKIIEGLALGKVIISTSIGAQGIPYTNGENLIIADDPRSFAEAISKCYKSDILVKKIQRNALTLAQQEFRLDNVGKKKIVFFKKLIENS